MTNNDYFALPWVPEVLSRHAWRGDLSAERRLLGRRPATSGEAARETLFSRCKCKKHKRGVICLEYDREKASGIQGNFAFSMQTNLFRLKVIGSQNIFRHCLDNGLWNQFSQQWHSSARTSALNRARITPCVRVVAMDCCVVTFFISWTSVLGFKNKLSL